MTKHHMIYLPRQLAKLELKITCLEIFFVSLIEYSFLHKGLK